MRVMMVRELLVCLHLRSVDSLCITFASMAEMSKSFS